MTSIPTIDVRSATVGADIMETYSVWGFGYVVGHPIDSSLLGEVFAQTRRFHALPLEEKMRIEVNQSHRGYIPISSSTEVTSSVEKVTKPNQSESLMLMRDLPSDHPDVVTGTFLSGANQWPDLSGFREVMEEYHAAMWDFSYQLVAVIADELGDDGSMVRTFDSPLTWLRLLHYPPQEPTAPQDEFGLAPHSDFGAITLLAQDDVGGLSVRTPDGAWVDVTPREGAYVMNVGDMLHRWSNGRLLSTPHRVTNRSGRERYSVPFFFDPHVSTVIEPLPSLGAPRFEPLLFSDFLRYELEAGYDVHRPEQHDD